MANAVEFQEVPHRLHYQAGIPTDNHLHTWCRNFIARRLISLPWCNSIIRPPLAQPYNMHHYQSHQNPQLHHIRRNIYGCSPEAEALACTSLVRPHLEHAASTWDPYLYMDITQLESVQRRAARFACRDCRRSTSVSGPLEHLHWPLLSARRINFRLVSFYKAVYNETALSTSHFQKPPRCTRNSDETTFIPLYSRTNP